MRSYKIINICFLLQLVFGSFCTIYYATTIVSFNEKLIILLSDLLPFAQSLGKDKFLIFNSYFFTVFSSIFIALGLLGLIAYSHQNTLLVIFHAILACLFCLCSIFVYILMVIYQETSSLLFLLTVIYEILIGSYVLNVLDRILLNQNDSCEIPINESLEEL